MRSKKGRKEEELRGGRGRGESGERKIMVPEIQMAGGQSFKKTNFFKKCLKKAGRLYIICSVLKVNE